MGSGDFAILDERFRPLVKVTARLERLYAGCRWAEGPVYVPAQRSLVWSDIPNDRMLRWDEATGATGVFRRRQAFRTATRSTAKAASSRASTATGASPAPSTTARSRCSPTLRRQALQQPERRRRQIRRLDLVHRSGLRHRHRLRGSSGRQRDRCLQRLSRRSRIGPRSASSPTISCARMACLLARRATALHRRHRRLADEGRAAHIRAFPIGTTALSGWRGLRRVHRRPCSTVSASTRPGALGGAGDGVHCFEPDGTLIGKLLLRSRSRTSPSAARNATVSSSRHDVALRGARRGQRREDVLGGPRLLGRPAERIGRTVDYVRHIWPQGC